jgi:hypothetical protein
MKLHSGCSGSQYLMASWHVHCTFLEKTATSSLANFVRSDLTVAALRQITYGVLVVEV